MAEEKKKTGLKSILEKEYKYEGLLLLFLGIIVVVLGVLIRIGISTDGASGLVINENFYFIGEYPSAFSWILIVLGALAIIFAIWPYYKPSVKEMKRITWPSKKYVIKNTLTVVVYVAIIAALFVGFDALLNKVVELFQWLAGLFR